MRMDTGSKKRTGEPKKNISKRFLELKLVSLGRKSHVCTIGYEENYRYVISNNFLFPLGDRDRRFLLYVPKKVFL